jgi:hypothetical protein
LLQVFADHRQAADEQIPVFLFARRILDFSRFLVYPFRVRG